MAISNNQLKEMDKQPFVSLSHVDSVGELSKISFNYLNSAVPHHVSCLLFRQLESRLPCRVSRSDAMPIFKRYVENDHKHDLWLRRSPVHPGVRVVRHSDFTSLSLLKKSAFYRRTLSKLNATYGASVVAWKKNTWLATLTLLRTTKQGDFSNAEIKLLFQFHEHFSFCCQRIAKLHEEQLTLSSLESVISRLPTGIMVLDWNLQIIHVNSEGRVQLEKWMSKQELVVRKNKTRTLPNGIFEVVTAFKERVANSLNTQGERLKSNHTNLAQNYVVIDFLPARILTMSRGTFLVHFRENSEDLGEQFISRLSSLSDAERKCLRLLAEGLSNKMIASKLGISALTVRNHLSRLFQKLKVKTRTEAIVALAKNDHYR